MRKWIDWRTRDEEAGSGAAQGCPHSLSKTRMRVVREVKCCTWEPELCCIWLGGRGQKTLQQRWRGQTLGFDWDLRMRVHPADEEVKETRRHLQRKMRQRLSGGQHWCSPSGWGEALPGLRGFRSPAGPGWQGAWLDQRTSPLPPCELLKERQLNQQAHQTNNKI